MSAGDWWLLFFKKKSKLVISFLKGYHQLYVAQILKSYYFFWILSPNRYKVFTSDSQQPPQNFLLFSTKPSDPVLTVLLN
jgi:hypothetical protein